MKTGESISDKALALHTANPRLIPGIIYCLPEHHQDLSTSTESGISPNTAGWGPKHLILIITITIIISKEWILEKTLHNTDEEGSQIERNLRTNRARRGHGRDNSLKKCDHKKNPEKQARETTQIR